MTTTETPADSSSPHRRWRGRCWSGGRYGTIDDEGETVDLGGGVYVYSSPDYTLDVNTLYVTTSDGVVVVDSQLLPRHAERVLRDIRARTDAPIRYVTSSHHHPDHVFGNPVFAEAGAELVSSYFTPA